IDPATGSLIGRGEGGEGLSMMEYLQLVKLNLSNLKCCLAFMNSFAGGAGEDAAKDWLMCMTGTDNPGSFVGWAGSVGDIYGVMRHGETLAKIGDCLAGAYELYGTIKGP
ncbi:MAG TPA: hypothetical protein PKO06_10115, partial [Candidatus Ozemobacteraceae bacterium]|nr:hypothetical protein [Candidatus Ozemobacteraceae bacterium]